MKFLLITLSLLTLMAGCGREPAANKNKPLSTFPAFDTILTVKNQRIHVAVADTFESRNQGLSGHERLSDTEGVLFDFRHSDRKIPSFWMKEMKFNLDIIWIKDGQVISIDKNVPAPAPETPLSELPHYAPPSEIDFVLEMNAGTSEKLDLQVGDTVQF